MKLVFAHDHKLRKIEGKYFTVGGLRDSIMERYLNFFDELTIICRVIDRQKYDNQLFELKNPSISVKAVSNGSLIISKSARRMIEAEIREADGLIVKLHSRIAEIAIHCARTYKIPYLVEVVGCPWDAYWNHSILGKIVAPFMMLTTKKEVSRAPYAIYVTKEFLEKRYPCKGKWIDCSDVEIINDNDEGVIEKRLKKIKTSNEVITLGTLAQVDVKYKGQEYVIQALSELNKTKKKYIYKLAGSGNESYLKKIAKQYGVEDHVFFCGVLSHDQVFEWLDDIDIYIQPSKQEGLPRSVIEAFSRACPCICSNVGGMSELVDSEFIFPKGNVKKIMEKILQFDQEKMLTQATQNYTRSKEYRKSFLDEKRNSFYKDYYLACKRK